MVNNHRSRTIQSVELYRPSNGRQQVVEDLGTHKVTHFVDCSFDSPTDPSLRESDFPFEIQMQLATKVQSFDSRPLDHADFIAHGLEILGNSVRVSAPAATVEPAPAATVEPAPAAY